MGRLTINRAGLWLVGAWLVSTRTARAQDPKLDADTLGQMSEMIRWSGVVTSLFVIAGAWLLLRFVKEFTDRLGAQFAPWRLFLQKARTFFQFLVYVVVAVVTLMFSFEIDDKVLALIGGTLAVSIGFAMKDLVGSMVAGIVVMADRPFQVGDRVNFEGHYGDVTAVGLRSVRIQTLDDNTVTVPNSKFLSEVVSSGNYGALDMQVVLDYYVGLDEDVDSARRVIHDAAISSRYIYLPKPVQVHVAQVITDHYLACRLRLKAYVLDTRHEVAFGTDVTLRVMRGLKERNIKPPRIALSTDTSPSTP